MLNYMDRFHKQYYLNIIKNACYYFIQNFIQRFKMLYI